MDCQGHGTHVAGIIGGNEPKKSIRGVATRVRFGAYRIFGCKGSVAQDVVIAAMQKAYEDGMDVINMSLGGDSGFPDSPEASVVDALTKKGAIFVIAQGNSGDEGAWLASDPAVAKESTAVASFDNIKVIKRNLTLSTAPSKKITFNYPMEPPSPPGSNFNNLELVASTFNTSIANDGCDPLPFNATNKIVLIKRGTCTFEQKVNNSQSAGAAGVVIYNSNTNSPFFSISLEGRIPVWTVSFDDGAFMAEECKKASEKGESVK
ncbi:hypothetical protein HK102_013106, partial [Quaeritorhiza haematococci]